ncbi:MULTISPECIES: amino acid ABC transporter permease/ATP-binding protein [Paraburkholderia]|uniref:Vitamin B12 import ATP-binding protein BtuD n=1 Tax=Paraburkholderia nemoris TaxID=2793076 RepID=A0ABM8SP45_9BURK|nr:MULTISPECIES: amino acid ABC transporter permease/ATP-binding protein [Paraburkholderia]MBK3814808.1 amino acid ABC transporter permease/ATP-binding protein [Paraburkholderia aspalathi]MBK5183315.1 amino acid ABC transporter permease/ATP-binding protein [Burkholderia sp. R-69749]CAE6823557.1 Vitamin B12 import ATP-binding protein BtuD [Paraburkholderia nemoris]CAE6836169.1 Vitamin B12 import ATP-binding protein BtuD [Paraburkholderia nemoris]CAE6858406.1 Vitamin B12 import ATP-binding prote
MSDTTQQLPGSVHASHAIHASDSAAGHEYAHYRVVPAKHHARTAGTVLAILLIAIVLNSVLGNPRWGWDVFAQWFCAGPVLEGLLRTLVLTALGALFGFALATPLALARVSRSPLMAGCAWAFIWLFRSIPPIVLLLLLNNLGYLYDTIWIGVPFTHIALLNEPTTNLISPFFAAVLGLTLNHAAFAAEAIRGGILSVDHGQREAAAALGLPGARQVRRIVLPQAMRSILPTAFNDVIGLAKGTSVVYILAMPDLFYTVQIIYHRNLEVIPLLMVATVWYLIILTVLSAIQIHIERYYARGATREQAAVSPLTALFRRWRAARVARGARTAQPETQDRTAAEAGATGWAQQRVGGKVGIHNVSKSFGTLKVLDNISLAFPSGSVTVILGQSGSGKSTLLRSINHLERIDDGFIDIDGELVGYRREGRTLYELKEKDILERRRAGVGMVFQNFNLFPHLTVLDNVTEAPLAAGVPRAQAETEARTLLARVGLAGKADAWPRQLSGGQQQRVAIARALALKPKVLLFDEPTSALDPELVNEVLDVIRQLARSGTTLIVVTHEIGFAREVADTIVFMDAGRVVESGPPASVLGNPAHPRTREFLSKVL